MHHSLHMSSFPSVTTTPSIICPGISAFIVDMKTPGISLGKKEDKLGELL